MTTLFTNGNFITVTDQSIDWLVIDNGTIKDMGMGEYPNSEKIIDLQGKTLMPGLINSHMHPLPTGMSGKTVPLFDCETLDAVFERIKGFITNDGEDLILAEGFLSMIMTFNKKALRQLDDLSNNHPVAIKYVTGHGMIVNGIIKENLSLDDYFVGSDEDMARVSNLYSDEDVKSFMTAVSDEAVENGFTTIHSLIYGDVSDNRDVPLWISEEKEQNKLKVQVCNYMQTMDVDLAIEKGLSRIGGCICLDGTPIEHSAAFTENYNDVDHSGSLYIEDEKLYQMVSKAHKNNIQCAFHAVGDRAVHQLIDCYKKVTDEYGKKGLRHRIEHVDLISDEKLSLANDLGLVFSVQPSIGYLYGEGFDEILGKERYSLLNSIRRYKDAGIILAGGTDSPVTPLNGFLGIHAAVHADMPLRRLNIDEAIEMFTINGAYAIGQENLKGSLEVGKQADFTILDQNPYEAEEIKDIKVLMTFVKGQLVFERK